MSYISTLEIKNKNILEIGAGSGLISIYCAKETAIVTATDISTIAIKNITENSSLNNVQVTIIHSDLFNNITPQIFDYIFINPPYYLKSPTSDADYAWYCGENGEYFSHLFRKLNSYIAVKSNVIIVLSEDCDLKMIQHFAAENNFYLLQVKKKIIWFETNILFRIITKEQIHF